MGRDEKVVLSARGVLRLWGEELLLHVRWAAYRAAQEGSGLGTIFAVFFVVALFRLGRSHPERQETADFALERALRSRWLGRLEAKDQEECARRI